jgi:SecD/SecF fusion protein
MMTNDSINQVIMRSVNTSLTELVPVIALLFFGGETLKDFGFAMFVGLISGVYSSIFIAAPVLAMLKEAEPRYRMIREKLAASNAMVGSRKKDLSVGIASGEVASPAGDQPPRNDGTSRYDDGTTRLDDNRNDGTSRPKTAAQKAKKKAKKKKRR